MRKKLVLCVSLLVLVSPASFGFPLHRAKPKTSAELRADYLAALPETAAEPQTGLTTGSIWTAQGRMVDLGADYKAHAINDVITVIASVQTTAAQNGSVDSERNVTANSAITGLAGSAPSATNPLLAAQSSAVLKGTGQSTSDTAFSTSLSGQVIAMLANGDMVIEAHRQIELNNQREEVIIRGIARAGDVTPLNTIASSQLGQLQVELKGKGIISDSVRPMNPITKAIMWLIGF